MDLYLLQASRYQLHRRLRLQLGLMVWHSHSIVGLISKVTLSRAQLVGRMTVFMQVYYLAM